MGVAIITGASSGLGREYVRAVLKRYPDIDEFWLIARRVDRLREVAEGIIASPGRRVEILPLDLGERDSFDLYKVFLEARRPVVRLLINCAGFGKLGDFTSIPAREQTDMISLNCSALTELTLLTAPYMQAGGSVINVCSIAAFLPTPGMTTYCSTKAYVLSFSKALREEWKPRRVNVLAVCPGPMETEFLPIADAGKSAAFMRLPRSSAPAMAELSLKRAFQNRAVYTGTPVYRAMRVLAKVLPHNLIMRFSRV